MSGHRVNDVLLRQTPVAVGASETDGVVVSNNITISAGDSKLMKVMVTVEDFVAEGTVTAKLQDSFDGGTTWQDAGSVSITDDGNFEINHNIYDGQTAPLWTLGRVIVTTAASSGVTVTAVRVTRR